MMSQEVLDRVREIITVLRSDELCDRDSLLKELNDIEDKYMVKFY